MKTLTNLLIIAAIILLCTYGVKAQTKVLKDAQGNYVQAKRDTAANKPSGHTFTDSKGNVYPVYVSSRGNAYYERKSKSGNLYKVYLKD